MDKPEITAEDVANEIGAMLTGDPGERISDVTHDSRQARTETLFVAIKGLTMDGHRFLDDVMRRGAAGVISEQEPPKGFKGAWLRVKDARRALAQAAAKIQGNPSEELDLVGITGTNGKTTTTYLVQSIAEAARRKCAMLTTVEYRIHNESRPAVRTTPEASDTQRFLREAVSKGCVIAAMEASSQAIHLRRCDELRFRVAIFTNLTRDHLDYHHTMDKYFDAKKELFDGRTGHRPEVSVINIDDDWGVRLANELSSHGRTVVTFSQQKPADLRALNIEVSLLSGTSFDLQTEAGTMRIDSPLVGKPHVYNMLSAAAAGIALGIDLESLAAGFRASVGAPGRFERVEHDNGFAVVVDYAHSDDALLNTLKTAKELAEGNIITVFGCGGDRDKSKRRPMGRVAGENSDQVVVTSDNPRTENPLAIIAEIESGLKETECDYSVEPDRKKAIFYAIAAARPNDVVIIAGKGHETYQIVGGDKFHFDDREIALEGIAALDI